MVEQADKLDRLYEDMYIGRGKGNEPMTIRMAMIEQKYHQIVERLTGIEKTQQKNTYLLIGTLLTLVGEIFIRLIK